MAKFKISPTTTVAELKEQFRNEVGGILRIYEGRSEAAEGATLVSLGAKEGELECRTSRTVGKFEEAFQNDLNLKVKVYTKDNWVKVLDGITLETASKLPNGMTKAKMEEYLSYKRDEKEETAEVVNEETTESVEVPEEYKGLPIIEIETTEIDINDSEDEDFPEYPTVGVVFHGYESNGSQGCVLLCDTHEELCERANDFIQYDIREDEDIPVRVIETKHIMGYGEADDLEEIPELIGCALNEYYDGGNKHSYQYEWPDWFPEKAIFVVDDNVFLAYNNGGIEFIDLTDAQLNEIKKSYSDEEEATDGDLTECYGTVSDDILDMCFFGEEGLAEVEVDGKMGYVNTDGKIVIKPMFDLAGPFNKGEALVTINKKVGLIDTAGKFIIEPKYEKLDSFNDGLAIARINRMYGFLDRSGNFAIEPKYDDVCLFSEGLAGVEIDGKYGYIDKKGNMVIEPQFDYGGFFCDGIAEVLLDGEKFNIDNHGNRIK